MDKSDATAIGRFDQIFEDDTIYFGKTQNRRQRIAGLYERVVRPSKRRYKIKIGSFSPKTPKPNKIPKKSPGEPKTQNQGLTPSKS
ncbi:MAG: hypothetical protein FWC51_02675 [Proteobacteria bacterium]|nr:hypothetical protein [Pseudomonadota bacterium]